MQQKALTLTLTDGLSSRPGPAPRHISQVCNNSCVITRAFCVQFYICVKARVCGVYLQTITVIQGLTQGLYVYIYENATTCFAHTTCSAVLATVTVMMNVTQDFC